MTVARVVVILILVLVVLVLFGGEAPRSVLIAWLRAALRARFGLCLFSFYSTLQITRFFEAPMPSLFHNDSRAETCEYMRSLPPSPASR
jgi:hypothetical protein